MAKYRTVARRPPPAHASRGELLSLFKALSDATRLRIVLALERQELCVRQVVELVGLAPSTVSKHVAILRQARLIESRKEGRWTYCRLARQGASPLVRRLLGLLGRLASSDPHLCADARHLRAILKLNREDLCSRQTIRRG